MATVSSFLNRVLRSITVLRTGGTASAGQSSNALEALNEMLGQWNDEGIPINDGDLVVTDTFPVDGKEKYAIRENLAVMLADELGKPISPNRVQKARELHNWLLSKYHPDYTIEYDTALVNTGGRGYDIDSDT